MTQPPLAIAMRLAVALGAVALGGVLLLAVFELPPMIADLPSSVAARLSESGVRHPVTAVLLNFRGYDTLLEVAVLFAALVGMLITRANVTEIKPAVLHDYNDVLTALARHLLPWLMLAAGYLLWAGAHRPGGAFQAAAILGAAAVLLQLAGLLPTRIGPSGLLRAGLASGLLVFLAVGTVLLGAGAFLTYPPALAGGLILFIEAALTVSLGATLACLYLVFASQRLQ